MRARNSGVQLKSIQSNCWIIPFPLSIDPRCKFKEQAVNELLKLVIVALQGLLSLAFAINLTLTELLLVIIV